jgi:hypothetical protein
MDTRHAIILIENDPGGKESEIAYSSSTVAENRMSRYSDWRQELVLLELSKFHGVAAFPDELPTRM